VTSLDHVIEIQFHSDENDNRTQDFRHVTKPLKGVWLRFRPGPLNISISIIVIIVVVVVGTPEVELNDLLPLVSDVTHQ